MSPYYNPATGGGKSMPTFSFKGQNRKGEKIAGERAADSRQALALALRREQILLLDASEKKPGRTIPKLEFGGNPRPKAIAVLRPRFPLMMDWASPWCRSLKL